MIDTSGWAIFGMCVGLALMIGFLAWLSWLDVRELDRKARESEAEQRRLAGKGPQ